MLRGFYSEGAGARLFWHKLANRSAHYPLSAVFINNKIGTKARLNSDARLLSYVTAQHASASTRHPILLLTKILVRSERL